MEGHDKTAVFEGPGIEDKLVFLQRIIQCLICFFLFVLNNFLIFLIFCTILNGLFYVFLIVTLLKSNSSRKYTSLGICRKI